MRLSRSLSGSISPTSPRERINEDLMWPNQQSSRRFLNNTWRRLTGLNTSRSFFLASLFSSMDKCWIVTRVLGSAELRKLRNWLPVKPMWISQSFQAPVLFTVVIQEQLSGPNREVEFVAFNPKSTTLPRLPSSMWEMEREGVSRRR